MNTYDIELDDVGFLKMEPEMFLLLTPSRFTSLTDSEYEEASLRFSYFGYEFIYLPKLAKIIPNDLLSYYIPECNGKALPYIEDLQNNITKELGLVIHSPLVIRFKDGKLNCIESCNDDETTADFLESLYDYITSENARFLCDNEDDCYCEDSSFENQTAENARFLYDKKFCFRPSVLPLYNIGQSAQDEDDELESLISELQEINEQKLRALGLSEKALRFLMGKSEAKVSHMRITKRSKIVLDDYNGLEIKLDAKTKAMYFLFLRHPEGIAIKGLPDHLAELMELYKSISGRDNPISMRKTMEDLVDPFQNNANISLSRIKKAFCEAFSKSIACNYYIDGERGGLRSISLNRNLVVWESR